MLLCPVCGAENIDGSDDCVECQASLTSLSLPQAVTALEKGLLKDRIEILQPRPPIAVSPETTVGDVLRQMIAQRLGCAVVVDDDRRLLGIFTERDALMRLNVDAARHASKPISSVMTANPATLRTRDKIAYALHRMDLGGYRHVPIVDDDERLVGVISIRGILAYLTERQLTNG
jgi:CBS domain-containing protein